MPVVVLEGICSGFVRVAGAVPLTVGLGHSPGEGAALGTTQSGSTVPQPPLVPCTGPVPLPLPRNLLRGTPPGQQPFVRLLRCVSVTRGPWGSSTQGEH